MRYIQIRKIEQHFGRKTAAKRSSRLRFAQTAAYKMSRSVSRVLLSYGHLSRRTVAGTLQPPRERPGKPNAPISVLLRIEFTASDTLEPTGALLPHLSTFSHIATGSLFLLHFSSDRSGRALPVILALWSPDFPHSKPFGFAARPPVLLALLIVKDEAGKVKKQKFVQGNR